MTRAALTWLDDDRLRVMELAESRTCMIGRESGSTVDLSDPAKQALYGTVSRRHAEIRARGGGWVIAHLSQTNPTRVNNVEVHADQPRQLADRDVVTVGRLRLMFNDLATGDRLSGVICPSCHRENEPSRQDCWYDGTNLTSALSAARHHIRVAGRLMAADGSVTDLYAHQPHTVGLITITFDERGAWLSTSNTEHTTVNGTPIAPDGQLLHTGDEVRSDETTYVILVR
jgi:hypothetical protein